MSKVNIPVLVVLYNPDINCIKRIESLKSAVDFYIFDNSSLENIIVDVVYYKSQSNEGLSGAILWMYQECVRSEHKSFLFFDQDTIFSFESLEYINSHFFNMNSFDLISHYSSEQKHRGLVEFVINSGTIYPLKILEKCLINLKKYYVDCVDLTICLTAKQNNFQIISNWAPGIDHFSDQGYYEINFGIFKIKLKYYQTSRIKEFYKAHFRLIYDSIFIYKSIPDTMQIFKFLIEFSRGQFLARLFRNNLSNK